MRASFTTAVKTPCTPFELAQGYELALGGDGNVSPGCIAVLMAHAALECGRDVKRNLIGPSCWNFNLGNIKAGATYEGLYTCIRLNEYLVENGKRVLVWFSPEGREPLPVTQDTAHLPLPVPPGHPQTRMRAHSTLHEGIERKIAFLRGARWLRALVAAERGDAAQYVAEIHAQRYFTADFAPYQRAVVSLAKTYRPIAEHVASTPLALPKNEERMVSEAIAFAATQPFMLADLTSAEHVAAVQFDLRQTLDLQGARDRQLRDS